MAETDLNEWDVPNSDDEQVSCKDEQNQEEEKWEIPLKVLLLYREIEKNGIIELKVKECRRGIKEDIVQNCSLFNEEDSQRISNQVEDVNSGKEIPGKHVMSAARIVMEKDKIFEPSAFDYTEESIDETSHLTRKIPKAERFQRKRVGTLENVISDLKRFRDMDSKDVGDADTKHTPTEDVTATDMESTR